MSEHDGLRDLLQKIAATVGDPPEHGLERVAARRRRRTRHRRGAVAAAVALAVSGVVAVPWLSSRGGDRADVSTDVAGSGPKSSKLPDVLELKCNPTGIDVPVANIRPQSDGMHLVVHNGHAGATQVWIESEPPGAWASGLVELPTGDTEMRQPAPPGELDIGCMIGGSPEERRINLVDADRVYEEPELSCPTAERPPPVDVQLSEETTSIPEAARLALGNLDREEYDVLPMTGYEDELYGYKTTSPRVRILDGEETVAFVEVKDAHTLANDGQAATGPWIAARVGMCNSVLEDGGTTSTTLANLGSATPE